MCKYVVIIIFGPVHFKPLCINKGRNRSILEMHRLTLTVLWQGLLFAWCCRSRDAKALGSGHTAPLYVTEDATAAGCYSSRVLSPCMMALHVDKKKGMKGDLFGSNLKTRVVYFSHWCLVCDTTFSCNFLPSNLFSLLPYQRKFLIVNILTKAQIYRVMWRPLSINPDPFGPPF